MTSEEVAPAVRSILEAAERRRSDRTEPVTVDPRPFPAALEAAGKDGRAPVIAEVKPTSPTTDGTRADDPVELAQQMVAGGAAALSVLTEPTHFGGSPDSLEAIRAAVDVPVLRKDFILREEQLDVVEADLILLIVRFVEDLEALLEAARDRGFQVLVEVHDEAELATALEAGADIIGVNNRDLAALEVDLATFERVAPNAPEDVTLIAESGVSTPADVERMLEAGADGLLIGSAIMADGDVQENTAALTQRKSMETDRHTLTDTEEQS